MQLEKLNPQFPKLDKEALRDLEKIRKALLEQASILEKRKPGGAKHFGLG